MNPASPPGRLRTRGDENAQTEARDPNPCQGRMPVVCSHARPCAGRKSGRMGGVRLWHDFWFSVNTVVPLMLVMAAGFLARKLSIVRDEGVKQANSAVFHIFLPILLCVNIMDTQLGVVLDGGTLLYALAAVLVSFLILFAIAPAVCPLRETRGVFIQGVARSNYAIYGIPLVMMMYPDADTSISALMVVAVVPLFNVMATVALSVYSGKPLRLAGIARGVALNPLILGTVLGFLLWFFHLQPPAVLLSPLRMLGSIATPLALFLLGASLDFGKARARARLLWVGVTARLLLLPFLFLSVAVLLGIRDVSLATLIAVFASPTAVSSYPMAQQIGGDADFAAAQVVFTTAFSSFTVFLWVFAFRTLGWLA